MAADYVSRFMPLAEAVAHVRKALCVDDKRAIENLKRAGRDGQLFAVHTIDRWSIPWRAWNGDIAENMNDLIFLPPGETPEIYRDVQIGRGAVYHLWPPSAPEAKQSPTRPVRRRKSISADEHARIREYVISKNLGCMGRTALEKHLVEKFNIERDRVVRPLLDGLPPGVIAAPGEHLLDSRIKSAN